ncbi:MAG: hypothetical protein V1903_03360 [Bacteroidota bacterium]
MKKIITLLTGIVFLLTFLSAGGCTRANAQKRAIVQKKVTIYLRSIEINGEKHLSMFDTYGNLVTDSLRTFVKAGGIVFWELDYASGIEKLERIYSPQGKKIFITDAKKQVLGKGFKLKVPDALDEGTEEEYIIEYIDQDNSKVKIDPYIRIKD